MNQINFNDVDYIRYANRTLEHLEIRNPKGTTQQFWIYNYEGKHFRVFESEAWAWDFLDNKRDVCMIDFECEKELDKYLQQLKF